jgi:hypothetical protein
MTTVPTPYQDYKPGQLIEAERMNQMQKQIKEDIGKQITDAKEEIKKGSVAQAGDAAKFEGKTSAEWETELDKVYALKNHSHENYPYYQRYLLELEPVGGELQPAVLIHNMGRNPIVQVYELLQLPDSVNPPTAAGAPSKPVHLAYCGPDHSDDEQALDLGTKSWDERSWGDPLDVVITNIEQTLDEERRAKFRAQFQVNFTLNAWLTNLEKAMFEPGPAQYHFDIGDIFRTKWVKDRAGTKVSELDSSGEWPPRFVYRPVLLDTSGRAERTIEGSIIEGRPALDVYHLNLKEVEIRIYGIPPAGGPPAPATATIRLMVLLRG